ncbi:hypothetical protein ARMSODRAFT_1011146 [Armillaria solidipes]|uniref:FAD-binding domain-containing protein n=1 Tax=Armillaria solidipes TaxID=1076256 RepID=A0A2H3CTF5_9AGAR|nr:hypothetical protein ARMSODRAFT_1011146 [Armillaria solidipes]
MQMEWSGEMFSGTSGESLVISRIEFGEFTWLSYFRPNMRMVNKFQEGRAFVAGGIFSPRSFTDWGQGMNCSVQDVLNLAWKLSLILKNLSPPSLLSSYNDERLPVITQMLHATTQLYTHTVAKEKPVDAPEKDTKEDEKASGWFRWRNTALEMYGINYRYSQIILEERDTKPQDPEDILAHAYSGYEGRGSLRAGDRAPEAPGLVGKEGETTLLKLFKPSVHTVLVFASERDVLVEEAVKALPPQDPNLRHFEELVDLWSHRTD